jgi:hypothetical protein
VSRAVASVVVLILTAWLGSVLAGCFHGPACNCPPARAIDPGFMTIKRSTRPELIGGEVEIQPSRVLIRYVVDAKPREIVFAAQPH